MSVSKTASVPPVQKAPPVMTLPTLDFIAPNFTRIGVGPMTFWFSYRTCIAFADGAGHSAARQNEWGPTTGKHLNAIDNSSKRTRLPAEAFQKALRAALDGALDGD